MVCWGGARPRPGPRLPPLDGGGQAAMHWAACCPPTGAQVTGESSARCVVGTRTLPGRGLRTPWWGVQMHDSGALVHPADVRRVRARLSDRRARCLRASASSLCVGCRCDVQCGAMRVDALGSAPPVQP